jgi:fumarate reductase flavoprotein subunit
MEKNTNKGISAYKNLILFAVMMVAAIVITVVKPSGSSYTGSAQGIESTVTVTITVDSEGTITKAVLDVSGESDGLGADIGDIMAERILEAQSNDIDVYAGCTVTSNAIKTALADAMTQAGLEVGNTYTASAQGMGTVTVTVTIEEDGTISGLEIDASNETESLGQVAAPKLQEAILAAGTVEGIDAISGCTVTSNAVFQAINECLEAAGH